MSTVENGVSFEARFRVQVVVHGVRLHHREHGNFVGEMSAVNLHVSRSATIEAVEPTVAWKISHSRLAELADEYPVLWRRIAVELTGASGATQSVD